MVYKYIAAIVAVLMVLVYLGPVVVKLWDPALTLVILSSGVLMILDLWQSLKSKGD